MDEFDKNFRIILRTIQAGGVAAVALGCLLLLVVATGVALGAAYLSGVWTP